MKYLLVCFLLLASVAYAQKKDTTHVESQELTDLKINREVRNEMVGIFKTYGSIVALAMVILAFFGFRSYGDFKEALKTSIRADLEKFVTAEINQKYAGEFLKTAKEIERLNLRSQLNEFKIKLSTASKEKDKTKILESVKNLFDAVHATNDTDLVVQYLEFMSRIHFILREYEDISALIRKYGDKYQLSYGTWADNAIANMDLYELYGSSQYKNGALESADKALMLLPNYGTALAVKILIYSIDYVKNPPNKVQISNDINNLLLTANSGSDNLVSFETWDYLERSNATAFKKYVDMLLVDFKIQMDLMIERYDQKAAQVRAALPNVQDII